MENELKELLLAGDPVETVENSQAFALMPIYACWNPDPRTIDVPALVELLAKAKELGAAGIDGAIRYMRDPAHADFASDIAIVEFVDDGRDHVVRYYGRNMVASLGRDYVGTRFSALANQGPSARAFGPSYDAVAMRREALYCENSNTIGLTARTWRRLIVPTIDATGKVDGVIVASGSGDGVPNWPIVTPKQRPGECVPAEYRFARDRYLALSGYELTRQIQTSAHGLLGVGQVGVAILANDLSTFRYVSERFGALLGFDPVSLTGGKLAEILERPEDFAPIRDAFTAGRDTPEFETVIRRRDGSRMFARLSLARIEYNSFASFAVWLTDLTEHKRLQEELAAAQAQTLRESAARQRLWVSLAHDIRTPVNAIKGFADALEILPKVDEARAREYGGLIRRASVMLSTLIGDLLDLSRLDAGKYQLALRDIDPAQPIKAALEIARPLAAAKSIALEVDLAIGLGLKADPDALARVAVNLLSNAIKFTPNGGRIAVCLRPEPRGGVALAISDSGRGISPEALARLTKPYEQADAAGDRRSGTGLGLSIVKGLVELHGGTLELESNLGQGTTVTVSLP